MLELQRPCEWTSRCAKRAVVVVVGRAPAAPEGRVERQVCLDHQSVALAIGYVTAGPVDG